MLKKIALGLAVVFLALQLFPSGRTNPPVTGDVGAPPEVAAILRRSCYDCHSNETDWPWYSYVAPVSWWLVDHVNHGRGHLNFSTWDQVIPAKREALLEEAVHEVEEGHMPLPSYLWIHWGSKLRPGDLEVLKAWANGPP